MRTTILLAITLIITFGTAASAGPRQGTVWEPCDYTTGWKTNSCGQAPQCQARCAPSAGLGSPGRPCAQRAGASASVEAIEGGFKVIDSNRQALAYVYGHADKPDAETAKGLTLDEARRIASNIAKLPTLFGKGQTFFVPVESRLFQGVKARLIVTAHVAPRFVCCRRNARWLKYWGA